MGQARRFPPPQDFAKAVDDVRPPLGIAEAGTLLDGQLGDQRAHVRLAIAVGHPGKLGERPQPDGEHTGISLIGLPRPVHGIIDGLLGERVGVLDGDRLANSNPPAWVEFKCTRFNRA